MDLTTRCPECGTTFTASLQQLQLRKGYIRCVHCAHIFDGYEAVVSEQPAPAAGGTPVMPSVLRQRPSSNDSQEIATPQPPGPGHTVSSRPAHTSADDTHFTISAGPKQPAAAARPDPVLPADTRLMGSRAEPAIGRPQLSDKHVEPMVGEPRIGRTHSEPRIGGDRAETHRGRPGPDSVPDDRTATSFYMEPRHEALPPHALRPAIDAGAGGASAGARLLRSFWTVLVVVGLLVLLAQLAYIYRAQVANSVPVLRPLLERACVAMQCDVPYSRQIDQIAIMSSALRAGPRVADGTASGGARGDGSSGEAASGPAAPGNTPPPNADTMSLHLVLRNNYDKPQEWPTLVLDLTDFSGARVVRKNLPPHAYLSAQDLQHPFPAGSELTTTVPIALNGLKINGYQLDKFFQ